MNLVVDYGNSSAKVGIFEKHELIKILTFDNDDALKAFLNRSLVDSVIVSSVKYDSKIIGDWVINATSRFVLTPSLPLPVKNEYTTPKTLGMDRIAGVCGAQQLYSAQNILVIDAGTCITYDFVDDRGRYLGGSISPGLSMRFQAMHTLTAKLPLVKPVEKSELIGNSTETSMQSGVVNGMTAEIDGIISRYRAKYTDLRVILCGGDARFFENKLKESIFAVPELVLVGLNSILIHNVLR